MGAWGSGSFENDTALDFASEIKSLADIEQAFAAEEAEEIDADLGCQVIVAGECVAAMRGYPHPDMPSDLAEKVRGFGAPTMQLFDTARNNVSAVMGRGELLDLWAEAEEADRADFNRAMTDLVDRLNLPQRKPEERTKKKAKPTFNHSPCSFCDQPMGEVEASMFDITISADDMGSMKMGGWAHIKCLNAALHPKHLIQNWQIDDDLLDFVMEKIAAESEADD